jgi:hypothetical protein
MVTSYAYFSSLRKYSRLKIFHVKEENVWPLTSNSDVWSGSEDVKHKGQIRGGLYGDHQNMRAAS